MVKKNCPVCNSRKVNKNMYGFECLNCGYINNKEYINEKIEKKEIKVEFKKPVEKPKKIKSKKPKTVEDWIKKIKGEVDKGIEDYEKMFFEGNVGEKEIRNFMNRTLTKLKHIKKYSEKAEENYAEEGFGK